MICEELLQYPNVALTEHDGDALVPRCHAAQDVAVDARVALIPLADQVRADVMVVDRCRQRTRAGDLALLVGRARFSL